jgi:type I restriction enzyme S subunit
LSTTAARKLPFILPPLPEQIRIANKLDSILAKVDNAQARLEKIPTLLKRFRQAVLAAATSGELTREWREDEDCDYAERIFGDLILELKNGLSPKPNENAEGYPILRINAIRSGKVFQDDIRYLACEKKTLDTYKIKVGDLLFTRYNGSLEFVGVCGLVRELKHEYLLYPDKLMRVRLTHEVLPEYAELYFASSEARRSVTDCVKTTSGQKGISGKDIKEQKILLPNIEEQGEIVRRVESLFALADSVEKQYKAAKQRLDRLTQAVLAKAFRGELVPQDPDDEPAAELLKRIQAQRTQQHTGKKRHAAS